MKIIVYLCIENVKSKIIRFFIKRFIYSFFMRIALIFHLNLFTKSNSILHRIFSIDYNITNMFS